jgi:hypothetical protein
MKSIVIHREFYDDRVEIYSTDSELIAVEVAKIKIKSENPKGFIRLLQIWNPGLIERIVESYTP